MSFLESFNVDMFSEVSLEILNQHVQQDIWAVPSIHFVYFLDIKHVNYSSVSTTKIKVDQT